MEGAELREAVGDDPCFHESFDGDEVYLPTEIYDVMTRPTYSKFLATGRFHVILSKNHCLLFFVHQVLSDQTVCDRELGRNFVLGLVDDSEVHVLPLLLEGDEIRVLNGKFY